MKFSVLDMDRHSKISEIGSCSLLLKDVKHLAAEPSQKIDMSSFLTLKRPVSFKQLCSAFACTGNSRFSIHFY